ncbi:MAG TPA: acyltransferase [Halioglobus sp.]
MILGIQYLRAVAALMVVFHHARNFFGSHGHELTNIGTAGVDIFFVISGYVMAHSTRDFDSKRHLAAQASYFLQNRCVRIIPLYWLALAWQAQLVFNKGIIDAGMVRDFFFIPRYMPPDFVQIWPILPLGWTLNYEMFFYLIFGVAMLTANARYAVLTVVLLACPILGLFVHSDSAPVRFYTAAIPLEFLFGMLLYQSRMQWARWFNRGTAAVLLVAGFALLAQDNYPFGRVISDGLPAAIIVGAAIIVFENRQLPLLRLLGDASYSIYITHLFAFPYAGKLSRLFELQAPTAVNMALVISLHLLLATMLGVLVHKAIEKPLTSTLQIWVKRRRVKAPAIA